MEIKSIPEIIKEMDYLVKEEKYDEAYQFAKENINLNKEYVGLNPELETISDLVVSSYVKLKGLPRDFPGGLMVKNPPARRVN